MILAPRNIQLLQPIYSSTVYDAEVVVAVGLHNQAGKIRRCLSSIFEQDLGGRKFIVLLLDDNSTDGWEKSVSDLLTHPELIVLSGNCGTAARTRNAILDYVDLNFPNAQWVARLDADDRFSTSKSLAAACDRGDSTNARYVLGGNRLVRNGQLIQQENPATDELFTNEAVLAILHDMAEGTARNELPSCNLLLATRSGWRYPDIHSAEDHWLVADLLLNHDREGTILESPYYCDYTLGGSVTNRNIAGSRYTEIRRRLFEAVTAWNRVESSDGQYLGHGQEGVVRQADGQIEKHFYPGVLTSDGVEQIKDLSKRGCPFLPDAEWQQIGHGWMSRYPYEHTHPADNISIDQAREFLAACLDRGFVCKNIKRENFRLRRNGSLCMVDIGKDIVPMTTSYFRDSAARLFAIAALNWPDGELLRRKDERRQEVVLAEIPGFEQFYKELMVEYAQRQWSKAQVDDPCVLPTAEDVTLLIKCCAMDADILIAQVRYIVSLLSKPRKFSHVILSIDPFKGPFLRQYCQGDFELLMQQTRELVNEGVVDRFIVAPESEGSLKAINLRWFGLDCARSHSSKSAPVTSQLWAFEQVATRYVLQCDVDVMIGRRDLDHDYLMEMVDACASSETVLGVAFNIPHPEGTRNPYEAPPGEYVPEVRCGLLDLERIKACRPLPNTLTEGRVDLTWHRSLQECQQRNSLRTLRGGDARSFYVHPENHWKGDLEQLSIIRDLIAQGAIPPFQIEGWDLKGESSDWSYPARDEDIVFLLKGRNTPREKLKRCLASLRMQDDQGFGLIVIDDASDETDPSLLQHYLAPVRSRVTLIRRNTKMGRIPNFVTAISDICTNPETLIVILDLDDTLMHPRVVSMLREKYSAGHDVILGGMFRPDKPLKIYSPSFEDVRAKWGADVWIHLRTFRKYLFDAIPSEDLMLGGAWIEECTDYATMIPIVEASRNPIFMDDYLYCHEPTTVRTLEVRLRKEQIILAILDKQPISIEKVSA